jgi:hypothetical protein
MSKAHLPIARPIYTDVEAIDTIPLIEPRESCAAKTVYNICTCLLFMLLLFFFFFYMVFML